ncbi:MAG: radical SAM family heme chaperone HemW [Bacteroidaceae bacterium]|nr:radical SAM family heme chaperone HemW [Bacteroidaceae bacterium]
MAGIYVHVPFCYSRCIYCDFYSTTSASRKDEYVDALCREIGYYSQIYPHACAHTIYIGGGTPSQLSPKHIASILAAVCEYFTPVPDAEITMEMNPDDVTADYLCQLISLSPSQAAVNRVSLGIQTFSDPILRLIRRRHDAATAISAVRNLQQAGIRNISIDLIYGLPGQSSDVWQHDLDIAFSLGVKHISAYALMFEEGTPLWRMRERGEVSEADESLSVSMYQALCDKAETEGFHHYEISNFALPGYESRHNSSYWTSKPYIGFGPGAHSYNGDRLRWLNRPDLDEYISCWKNTPISDFKKHHPDHQIQPTAHLPIHYATQQTELTDDEIYNETVMCGLRTSVGIDLHFIEQRFGKQRLDYLLRMAAPHITSAMLINSQGRLRLSRQALMVSDDIMSDLMLVGL